MLRFATITLSNPAKPSLPAKEVRAIVTDEDFGLMVGQGIADQLQLMCTNLRETVDIGEPNMRLLPYVGPLCVTWGDKAAFTGAVQGPYVAIGKCLAGELEMEKAPNDAVDQRYVPLLSPVTQDMENVPEEVEADDVAERREPLVFAEGLRDNPLDNIMIREHVIDTQTCWAICQYAATHSRARLGVLDVSKEVNEAPVSFVDTKARDTFMVPLDDSMRLMLNKLLCKLYTDHVEPFYGVDVEWWETPQMLSYVEGGRYDAHVDADRWVKKKGGGNWEPYLDRQVSILLYVNDKFTGGMLNFPDLKLKVQPKPGMLVAFPSSSSYRHGAEPTESGERLALVSWAAVKGVERLRGVPKNVNYMHVLRGAA